MLPPDLRSAEAETLTAVRSALAAEPRGRWTVEWRFEGLRLLAPALRLAGDLLTEAGRGGRLLFADEGAAALARRESEILAPRIASYGDERRRQGEAGGEGLLLLVSPVSMALSSVSNCMLSCSWGSAFTLLISNTGCSSSWTSSFTAYGTGSAGLACFSSFGNRMQRLHFQALGRLASNTHSPPKSDQQMECVNSTKVKI